MAIGRFRTALYEWVIDHDDSWAFIIAYTALAVVLSLWISLFWLVAVAFLHGCLEWVRQSQLDRNPVGVVARITWELKLDLALVIFALGLSLYMDVLLGAIGLRAVGRAGIQGGARLAAWQGVLQGTLLTVDDAAQVVRMVAGRKLRGGEDGDVEGGNESEGLRTIWGGWLEPWSRGDWFAMVFGFVCTLLIVLAPMLTDHTASSVITTLMAELHPWPSK